MLGVVVRKKPSLPEGAAEKLAAQGVATVHEAQGRSVGLMKPYMRPIYPGAAIAGLYMLCRPATARHRWVGLALLAGVALKLLLETPWQTPLRTDAGWGFPVAVVAHATGALAGWLAGAVALGVRRAGLS